MERWEVSPKQEGLNVKEDEGIQGLSRKQKQPNHVRELLI
jgi:hypothetical protein